MGLDFRKQLPPFAITLTPAMTNVVTDRDGRATRHDRAGQGVLGEPGLSSTRGGQNGHLHVYGRGLSKERLLYPRLSTWATSGWTRLGQRAGRLRRSGEEDPRSRRAQRDVVFSCFDHGGAGGGFENTWGTGKLMFSAIRTPLVRIHNRPAYNSECHATREMGIGELNNSYEDAELADVIWSHRRQPLRNPDQLLPLSLGAQPAGLDRWTRRRSGSRAKKRGAGHAHLRRSARHRFHRHLPSGRRQGQRAASGHPSGNRHRAVQRPVHLRGRAGLDRPEFIAKRTDGFDDAVAGQQCQPVGVQPDHRRLGGQAQAGGGMGVQTQDRSRTRTCHTYEKGIIWGNDNYPIQSSLVDLVHRHAQRAAGAAPAVCAWAATRKATPVPRIPGDSKIYVDQEIIDGKGKMMTGWGATTSRPLQCANFRDVVLRRSEIVKAAMRKTHGASRQSWWT